MSYSIDFRKYVFKIKERDSLTFRQTGERFGISPRTLFKWKKCMEPRLHRNKPATKIDRKPYKSMLKTARTVISTNGQHTLAQVRAVSCMPCGV